MKIAFLALCGVCALLLNLVIFSLLTGRVPFRAPEPVKVVEPVKVIVPDSITLSSDKERVAVDDLIKALNTQKEELDVRGNKLTEKEDSLKVQEAALNALRNELQTLQSKLEKNVVEIQQAEQVNLKRLADVCSKMEPASASKLLQEMEKDRAGSILCLINERPAAAIMDAAIGEGQKGAQLAKDWAEVIRRTQQKKAKPEEGG